MALLTLQVPLNVPKVSEQDGPGMSQASGKNKTKQKPNRIHERKTFLFGSHSFT